MKSFVTGAAGFIGSHLAERLLADGDEVVGWDNFSTGREAFVAPIISNPQFQLIRGDMLDFPKLTLAMAGCQRVFHLAANADVRFGLNHPGKDLEQNTIATFNVLEAMRSNQVQTVVFSSTGSVYGDADIIPTPENAPFPVQTSLYGASKLAGEGLIQAYCEGFGFEGYIFRFVSILGERYTHGHVIDFYKQLLRDPTRLWVLGDGSQRKSYLYVHDCISAILHVIESHQLRPAKARSEVYNLGTQEYCTVIDSIGWICSYLDLTPAIEFTGGDRGWIGDNPFIFLDTSKVRDTGWAATVSIRNAVVRTVSWLRNNQWALDRE